MPADVGEGWADRRRANEDEYFRKRDQELVEKARLRAEHEAALQRFAEAAGVSDEDILRDLQNLGYTAETVTLIHVMPLIAVARADGHVSEPERDVIIAAARARGIEPASQADRQLAQWLANPPSAVMFDGTRHLFGAVLQKGPPDVRAAVTRDLLASCHAVASASGGILGFRSISDKEQRAVDRIRYELERKDAPSSHR
jgi:hypothetical protein